MIKKKAEYRSSIRSKNLIREAFIKLLEVKHPEKITISDIVTQADINRSTFYAHYKSTQDLMSLIAEEMLSEINFVLSDFNFIDFIKNPSPTFRAFTAFLNKNQDTYKKLSVMQGVDSYLQGIKAKLTDFALKDESVPEILKKDEQFIASLSFYINGIIYIFRDKITGTLNASDNSIIEMLSGSISVHFNELTEYLSKNGVSY